MQALKNVNRGRMRKSWRVGMFRSVSNVNCRVKSISCINLENHMCVFSARMSVIREQDNV